MERMNKMIVKKLKIPSLSLWGYNYIKSSVETCTCKSTLFCVSNKYGCSKVLFKKQYKKILQKLFGKQIKLMPVKVSPPQNY